MQQDEYIDAMRLRGQCPRPVRIRMHASQSDYVRTRERELDALRDRPSLPLFTRTKAAEIAKQERICAQQRRPVRVVALSLADAA
jgi:hypothetical protein